MLSDRVFKAEFCDYIAIHFGVDLSNPRVLYGYCQAFSGLTDDRFTQVMQAAFTECTKWTFSVPWVLERSRELAELEALSVRPALPSDLDRQSEAERAENIARMRKMTRDICVLKLAPGEASRLKSAAPNE